MNKALVMGVTGSFGSHIAKELIAEGWQVKVLVREPRKLSSDLALVEVCQGTAGSIEEVRKAAADVEVIIYGINPANYDWEGKAIEWLDITARVAEENQLTIVFPGNVYVFNPADGPVFNEDSSLQPITHKGVIRLRMEQRLQQASSKGVKVVVVRAGDFIAMNSQSSWIQHIIKSTKNGYQVISPGPVDLKHTWAYLPDFAHVVVALINRRNELAGFNVFHFSGYRASVSDIAQTIKQVTGEKTKIKSFPWFIVKLLSPFSILLRGMVEMSYLWREEVYLDDTKTRQQLHGQIKETELSDAIMFSGLLKR